MAGGGGGVMFVGEKCVIVRHVLPSPNKSLDFHKTGSVIYTKIAAHSLDS